MSNPKKHYYTWQDIEDMCVNIIKKMYSDEWKPDLIVGLTRGGNIPATIISNTLDIPCEALKVSFRDDHQLVHSERLAGLVGDGKKILVVDDINDTGATFNWIWDDWDLSTCEHNVKFATLTENISSDFGDVSYHVHEVNKAEEDVWLVYPWENIGEYNGV